MKVWRSASSTMKRMLGCWLAVVAVGFDLMAEAPLQTLAPYTIVGRGVNWDGVAFDSQNCVRMTVCKEGKLLASCLTTDPDGNSPWNFRLVVQVASAPIDGYATVGDTLELTAEERGTSTVYSGLVAANDLKIDAAGAYAILNIMLATDENHNGIADEYEKSKEYEMWLLGIDGPFDPEADYDHDGASNRNEYLAGTDPFNPEDLFRASTVSEVSSGLLAITFGANAGRTYVVKESETLASGSDAKGPKWRSATFFLSTDPTEKPVNRVSNDSTAWAQRTIYLIKGDGNSRFYRLEVEQ